MRFRFALLSLALAAPAVAAQNAPKFGCTEAVHRQFDFWIGEWDVTVQEKPAGRSSITLEEQGCVIHEHWTGSRGGTGQSFNFYDPVTKDWHQVWVDNSASWLHLTGHFADDKMMLTGVAPGQDNAPTQQRLTFFKNADGTVRQLWETSTDGKTWSTAFDGLYRKRKT